MDGIWYLIIGGVVIYFWVKNSKSKQVERASRYSKIELQAIETVSGILLSQKEMFFRDGLPEKAKDSYSIGYISGLVDACVSSSMIDDIEKVMAIYAKVLTNVFGDRVGMSLFKNSLSFLSEEDEEFLAGQLEGGQEFYDFMRGSKQTPLGWSGYIRDNLY